MGEALIKGMLNAKVAAASQIQASDKNRLRLDEMKETYGIRIHPDNKKLAEGSDVLVLAVKPQDVAGVLPAISSAVKKDTLLISIAAGIRVTSIIAGLKGLKRKAKVIRAMPNIAALVGHGACAVYSGPGVSQEDEAVAVEICESVGKAVFVKDEGLLDAVTGLSGSGPAYIFLILEALSDAGVRMGLSREISTSLAVQTLLGSAHLALSSGKSFSELKEMVTSPGGTTIEGLKKLEERRVRAAFMEAVEAATARARQLSGG